MDMTELQGLLSQFQPNDQDKAAANKQAFMALGLGLLGARRGFEFQQLGQAGMGAMQAKQDYLQNAMKERQANLSQAATLSDMMRKSQFANELMGGARPQIGPPMGGGTGPVQMSPQQSPTGPGQMAPPPSNTSGPGQASPPQGSIIDQLREMGVPDIAIKTAAMSNDPPGAIAALVKEYSQPVFGQGKIPLMRGPNGSFRAVVPQGFNEALAAQTGAETGAQEAAKFPYQLDTAIGPNGAPMRGFASNLYGQPPIPGQQAPMGKVNLNLQNAPPNEVAAVLADIQSGGKNVPMSGGGVIKGPDPLAMERAKADIATQASQNTGVADAFGKDYVDMVKAEKMAPANIQKYNNLKSLYSQVSTGKLAGQVQGLKQLAAYVAPDLAQSWTKDVPYAQAATALSNAMALELRNPAGGAGMPGSLSDADRQYLQSMISSVQTDPRAIPMILDTKIALETAQSGLGRHRA
jgi:hypothetical protein